MSTVPSIGAAGAPPPSAPTEPTPVAASAPSFFGGHKTAEEAVKGFESMLGTIGWKPEQVFGEKGLFKDATDPRAAGAWELGQKLLGANVRKVETLPDVDPLEYLEKQGWDSKAATEQFVKDGKLPPSELAKLKGIPPKWVERYYKAEHQAHQATAALNKFVFESALGGPEESKKAIQWANANLSPTEIAVIDKMGEEASKKGDMAAFQGVYADLRRRYQEGIRAGQASPASGTPSPVGAGPFRSNAEMREASEKATKEFGHYSKSQEFMRRLGMTETTSLK